MPLHHCCKGYMSRREYVFVMTRVLNTAIEPFVAEEILITDQDVTWAEIERKNDMVTDDTLTWTADWVPDFDDALVRDVCGQPPMVIFKECLKQAKIDWARLRCKHIRSKVRALFFFKTHQKLNTRLRKELKFYSARIR
eukprot:TRINITY_DN72588_c0_g1_i1.p2 TRINITY_DN72588_c0_g1~~TRINITY_DN72588_c0_g1_i1.p2  ORF type:complete len:139 (+),score=53.31 TRINITY_DN72588_c0_g1_i1:69-485(+)